MLCSCSFSIFGSVEIFNLNPDKVSKVQIWLMYDIDGPQRYGLPESDNIPLDVSDNNFKGLHENDTLLINQSSYSSKKVYFFTVLCSKNSERMKLFFSLN